MMATVENTSYVEKYAPDKPILGTMELFTRSAIWLFVEDIGIIKVL